MEILHQVNECKIFLFSAADIPVDGSSGMWIYPNCGNGLSLAAGDVHDQLTGRSQYSSSGATATTNALAGGGMANWEYVKAINNDVLWDEVPFAFMSAGWELDCIFSDSFQHDVDLKIEIQPDLAVDTIVISS